MKGLDRGFTLVSAALGPNFRKTHPAEPAPHIGRAGSIGAPQSLPVPSPLPGGRCPGIKPMRQRWPASTRRARPIGPREIWISVRIPALKSVSLSRRFSPMHGFADYVEEFWPAIRQAWDEHRDKNPILECDVVSRTVAAFPARQYIDTLSERTRDATHRQFSRIKRAGGTLIFIRDGRNQVLQSRIFAAREMEASEMPRDTLEYSVEP